MRLLAHEVLQEDVHVQNGVSVIMLVEVYQFPEPLGTIRVVDRFVGKDGVVYKDVDAHRKHRTRDGDAACYIFTNHREANHYFARVVEKCDGVVWHFGKA